MFHWYVKPGSRILLVDDAEIVLNDNDVLLDLKLERCHLPDVIHLDKGIYDAIVFPIRPPNGILKKAIEKALQYVFICGIEDIVKESGCDVLRGSPETLILRKLFKKGELC